MKIRVRDEFRIGPARRGAPGEFVSDHLAPSRFDRGQRRKRRGPKGASKRESPLEADNAKLGVCERAVEAEL